MFHRATHCCCYYFKLLSVISLKNTTWKILFSLHLFLPSCSSFIWVWRAHFSDLYHFPSFWRIIVNMFCKFHQAFAWENIFSSLLINIVKINFTGYRIPGFLFLSFISLAISFCYFALLVGIVSEEKQRYSISKLIFIPLASSRFFKIFLSFFLWVFDFLNFNMIYLGVDLNCFFFCWVFSGLSSSVVWVSFLNLGKCSVIISSNVPSIIFSPLSGVAITRMAYLL